MTVISTVWECLQHLVRKHEKDGISHDTAILLKKIDAKAEPVKDLAYCLYDISANKRRDAKEATAYNALIADWTELTRQAAAIHDTSEGSIRFPALEHLRGSRKKMAKHAPICFRGHGAAAGGPHPLCRKAAGKLAQGTLAGPGCGEACPTLRPNSDGAVGWDNRPPFSMPMDRILETMRLGLVLGRAQAIVGKWLVRCPQQGLAQ